MTAFQSEMVVVSAPLPLGDVHRGGKVALHDASLFDFVRELCGFISGSHGLRLIDQTNSGTIVVAAAAVAVLRQGPRLPREPCFWLAPSEAAH